MADKTKAELKEDIKALKAEIADLKKAEKQVEEADCATFLSCAFNAATKIENPTTQRRVQNLINKALGKL